MNTTLAPQEKESVNIMVDIETLGTAPGSVIWSIGACSFTRREVLSKFSAKINVQSCLAVGLKIDFATILWWMQQSDEARKALDGKGDYLSRALCDLSNFIQQHGAKPAIWGNGAGFDNVLLNSAYEAQGINKAWGFSQDRCYRTMKNAFPQITMEREGTHHDALSDAVSQAKHLIAIWKHIDILKSQSGLDCLCKKA